MINTVYELITNVMAKQYPDRVAFRYVAADGKTVVEKTYAQYVQDIRRAVTYFKENIPDIKGKRVGIMSRNCYEYGVNSFPLCGRRWQDCGGKDLRPVCAGHPQGRYLF